MSDMETTPRVSVVIPTWNRRHVLGTTLDRIASQSFPAEAFEVLVVDDGSTDGTDHTVLSLVDRVPFVLRYLRHENRGPGFTQNRGIRHARADLILLLTNDIWATPHLLRLHVEAHEREPGTNVAVLGRVVQCPELPRTVLHRHWDPFSLHEFEGRRELTCLHFWACNISFYGSFLLQNGLFQERQGAGNEDTELGYRLSRRGLRIIHEPRALGYHHHEQTLDAACRRAFQEGGNFDVMDSIPREVLLPFVGLFSFDVGWRKVLRMLPKAALRGCLFNPWFVDGLWVPALKLAERFAVVRACTGRAAYRGVFGCYYRKGIRAMRRKRRAADRLSPRREHTRRES